MAKAPLNEQQMHVLRWVVGGCPEGAWGEGDFTYKTRAQALQNRGLVKISRRRGVWRAEATAAGRHYLEHGVPPVPTARHEPATRDSAGGTRSRGPANPRPRPAGNSASGKPSALETEANATPRVHAAAKQPKKTLGEQLIDDVLAAGGILVTKEAYGPGASNWSARIRSAQRCGKLPAGQELVHRWRAGGREITIQNIPAWKLAVLDPIPVPERLHKPHAVVAALRAGEPALGLSRSVQPRALRLVQAMVAEAERRELQVQLTADGRRGHYSRRRDASLFTITAQGQPCGVSLGQEQDRTEHVPTAKELADAQQFSWVRIPKYDYALSDRLTITLSGGATHRQSAWKDMPDHPLEEQLPEILQEVDLRGLAAERKRAEEAEQARLKRLQWEEAVRQARVDYAEAFRVRVLEQQEKAWQQARRLSTFLATARARIEAMTAGAERTEAEAWLSWASDHVRSIDPLSRALRIPTAPEPRHSDLEPFLHGWSPYGPQSR